MGFFCSLSLYIQVGNILGVGLNKAFAGSNIAAHEDVKNFVGGSGVVNGYLFHEARAWIHGGSPQLIGVHFSETFVALNIDFYAANI
jgi:hypothetical protein